MTDRRSVRIYFVNVSFDFLRKFSCINFIRTFFDSRKKSTYVVTIQKLEDKYRRIELEANGHFTDFVTDIKSKYKVGQRKHDPKLFNLGQNRHVSNSHGRAQERVGEKAA